MKKTNQDRQASPKRLELRRATIRRLDTDELRHVRGGLHAPDSRTRVTTDP